MYLKSTIGKKLLGVNFITIALKQEDERSKRLEDAEQECEYRQYFECDFWWLEGKKTQVLGEGGEKEGSQ